MFLFCPGVSISLDGVRCTAEAPTGPWTRGKGPGGLVPRTLWDGDNVDGFHSSGSVGPQTKPCTTPYPPVESDTGGEVFVPFLLQTPVAGTFSTLPSWPSGAPRSVPPSVGPVLSRTQ